MNTKDKKKLARQAARENVELKRKAKELEDTNAKIAEEMEKLTESLLIEAVIQLGGTMNIDRGKLNEDICKYVLKTELTDKGYRFAVEEV